MAFEELKDNVDYIKEQAKSYADHSFAYYKLHFFKIIMRSSVSIMKFILVAIAFLMFLFFASLGLAFVLSSYLDSYALGFTAVAGLYVLVTVLLFLFKRRLIEGPLLKKCSSLFFNK